MWNDQVIAPTQATLDFQCRWNLVRRERAQVIPYFVDLRRFEQIERKDVAAVRRAMLSPDQELLIGIVGDVCRRKGARYLIQAIPRIVQEIPAARFVFLGAQEPLYVKHLQDLVRQLNVERHVALGGNCDQIPTFLHAIDLFVLPSLEEQMPMAILEAMALGKPVVATTVGGIPDQVVDGESGLLVPPRSAGLLAERLTALIQDGSARERLGLAARRRAATHFSLARHAAAFAALYRRLASDQKVGEPHHPVAHDQ